MSQRNADVGMEEAEELSECDTEGTEFGREVEENTTTADVTG